MTYIVGLTGGIGSGKTLVSDYFKSLGVPIIDTDVIARDVVKPGQATLQQLVKTFGETILQDDGYLDRATLRGIAFANSKNKIKLDAITHPAIQLQTQQQIEKVTYPYCIVVVPLMVESQLKRVMQRILVVTAESDEKVKRVRQRSNLSTEEVLRIMKTQSDDKQRLDIADDVLENNGSIVQAQKKVELLHQQYLELSSLGK